MHDPKKQKKKTKKICGHLHPLLFTSPERFKRNPLNITLKENLFPDYIELEKSKPDRKRNYCFFIRLFDFFFLSNYLGLSSDSLGRFMGRQLIDYLGLALWEIDLDAGTFRAGAKRARVGHALTPRAQAQMPARQR